MIIWLVEEATQKRRSMKKVIGWARLDHVLGGTAFG